MNKKIICLFFVYFLAVTAITVQTKSLKGSIKLLSLENIGALANDESGGNCSGGCAEIGWGSKQIMRCDCSRTGWFSSCSRWGC